MSHYRPYPAYKDSRVDWIGSVPKDWQVKPIWAFATCNDNALREDTSPDFAFRYVDISSVDHTEGITKTEQLRFADAPSRARRTARNGDIVVSTVRTYLKAVAAVDDAHADCVFSTGFAVLRARNRHVEPRFMKWLMLNDLLIQAVESHSEGLSYPAINATELVKLKAVVPSVAEQHVISDVLERETARIDALVAKKTEFIDLLNKKREALIAHAVTKGLNQKANMRASGVQWMADVPRHWEVVPSTWLFSEGKDRAHDEDQHLSATQKYGVIPLSEFERLEARQVTHAVKNLDQRKHVEVDDFVISMRSFEGGIERVKARGCVRSSYVVLLAETSAHVGFFAYLFKSSVYIQGLQATASFIRDGQDLSYSNFRQVKLPRPSIAEQREIAEFLDRAITRIDALVAKTTISIDLLKQRRAALITAAVTGQIDLREPV